MNKFNINDWCWFLSENQVVRKEVRIIEIDNGIVIYQFKGLSGRFQEKCIFATKEALMASL